MKDKLKKKSEKKCDGIVCYAGIDWWYHSQGHNDRQIMKRLIHRMPVLWVNPIGMRFPRIGKSDIVFKRYFRKFNSIMRGLRKDSSGIRVFTPIFIPIYTKTFLKINGFIVSLQVNVICRLLKINNPSVWITIPTALTALKRGNWHNIVFNRCDLFSKNPETDQDSVQELEKELLKISDYVLYSSRKLMDMEQNQTCNPVYLGHGVDIEHFSKLRKDLEVTAVLKTLSRPIIGYYGALDSFTIDLSLLIKTARKIYPATLLIIGLKSMDISELLREKNVVYKDPVPYKDIPLYAGMFNVGIMPWLRNEWMLNANPIKLKEYLAIGFPIVTIDFPALKPYKHLVYAADNHKKFLEMIDKAVSEDSKKKKYKRQNSVSNCSWDIKAKKVLDFIL